MKLKILLKSISADIFRIDSFSFKRENAGERHGDSILFLITIYDAAI